MYYRTKFKPNAKISFTGYKTYREDRLKISEYGAGNTMICVKDRIRHEHQTNIKYLSYTEGTAVKICSSNNPITINLQEFSWQQ